MSLIKAKAKFWQKKNDKVLCQLCPRACVLKNGKIGFCKSRQNVQGEMKLLNYGKIAAIAVDPIEKKPLYHFLPGTKILSVGTYGCNLSCKFCQNWELSSQLEQHVREISAHELVELSTDKGVSSLAFTYNEPTIFAEYLIDVASLCKRSNIRTVMVSSGYISAFARKEVFANIDAINIDLKAFSESFYNEYCDGKLKSVLDTIFYVKAKTALWLELTTLIIPGKNDSEKEIRNMAEWVVKSLGKDTPWHLSAFHPAYKLQDVKATTPKDLLRIVELIKAEGLNYVYAGNIYAPESSSTFCFNCKEKLIKRDFVHGTENKLNEFGVCYNCGVKIPGVWES